MVFRLEHPHFFGLGFSRLEALMLKRQFIAASIALPLLLIQAGATLYAQGPTPQDVRRLSTLSDIRTSIIRAIGAQDATVEVTVRGNVLTVWRPNSNMNQSTHAGRDNEATAIAAIVSGAIFGKPEFNKLVTLWVRYVVRSPPGGRSKNVDSIEFREDPNGLFQFHQT
jgi:hypothetical protein